MNCISYIAIEIPNMRTAAFLLYMDFPQQSWGLVLAYILHIILAILIILMTGIRFCQTSVPVDTKKGEVFQGYRDCAYENIINEGGLVNE